MKTEIKKINDDWTLIKNACRATMHKDATEKEPTKAFKRNLLLAEHSPIRLFEVYWTWNEIPYWVSQEWARHKFEKFISSQRNDRQDDYDRNLAPQNAPVKMDCYANMQNLIDAWRKRLCYKATKEARELAEDFKLELGKTHKLEADVLVPHCVYRGGCSELQCCGYYQRFLDWCAKNNLEIGTLQKRYEAYNAYFEERKGNRG